MAHNIASYIGNLGKSITYSAVDKFKEMAPAASSFAETNAELYKDMYSSVRNYKLTYQRAGHIFKTSKVYEASDLYINSLFQDISSGKLYNKERIDKIETKLAGFDESSSGFDEFDTSGFDSFGDQSSNSQNDTNILGAMIDDSNAKNADMISNAIARTGQYQVESNKANTHLLYIQNLQGFNEVNGNLSAINNNIGNVITFSNEVLKTHVENSKLFFENATKNSNEQTALLREIVSLMRPSTNEKNKRQRKHRTNFEDIVDAEGTPNLKEYFKNIKMNAQNELGQYIQTSGPMGENTNLLLAFGASPLKGLSDYLAKKLIPDTIETTMKELDKSISGFFGSLISKFNDMGNNSDNPILSTIGKIFGVKSNVKSSIETNNYEKGKVDWDGKSRKALIEVIPTYLSKIVSILSGKGEKMFDYEQGRFINTSNIKKGLDDQHKSHYQNATSDMRDLFTKNINKIMTFNSHDEKDDLLKDMESFFKELYNKGGFFDINSKTIDEDHTKYGIGNSKNFRVLRALFKNAPRGMQHEINKKILSERASENKNMENLEDEGSSIYNYLFNNSGIDDNLKKDSKGNVTSSVLNRLDLNQTKDKLGHNIFYYLQNMYKELSFIRQFGSQGTAGYSGGRKHKNISHNINEIKIKDSSDSYKEATKDREKWEYAENRFQSQQNKFIGKFNNDNGLLVNVSDIDDEDKLEQQIGTSMDIENLKDKLQIKKDKGKSFVDKLLDSQNLTDKTKTVIDKLNSLAKKPMTFITDTLEKVDVRLYEAIYGSTGYKYKGKDVKGFLNVIIAQIKNSFDKLNTWIDDKILKPIKEKFDVQNMKDLGKRVLSIFGIDADAISKSVKTYLVGDKGTGERGLFSSIIDSTKNAFKGAFKDIKDETKKAYSPLANKIKEVYPTIGKKATAEKYYPSVFNTTYKDKDYPSVFNKINNYKNEKEEGKTIDNFANGLANNISLYMKGHMKPYAKGSDVDIDKAQVTTIGEGENVFSKKDTGYFKSMMPEVLKYIRKMNGTKDEKDPTIIEQAAQELKNGAKKSSEVLFGKPDKDRKAFGEVVNDVSKHISDYVPNMIGSGLVGAGASLVTGAIGGPLLGAAVGAGISLTKNSSKVQDWLFGKIGKDGERTGGLIQNNTLSTLKKFLPDLKTYGIAGGVTGLLPFLPFGPVGGALLGAAFGFAKNTEVYKERMFGKAGIMSDARKDKLKKYVPRALAAMVPTLFVGPFGFLGNAALGAGIGMLSNTKQFSDAVFGKYSTVTKQNENGILPTVRDTLVKPIQKFYNKVSNRAFDWIEKQIMKPVETALNPIAKQIEVMFTTMVTGVGNYLNKMFENSVGVPLNKFIERKIITPFTWFFGKLFKLVSFPAKFVISSPFKLLGAVGNSLKKRQIRKGNADYMTAEERNNYRKEKGTGILSKLTGGSNDKFKEFDRFIQGMTEDEVNDMYDGLDNLVNSKDKVAKRKTDLKYEMGNEVSAYLGKYGKSKKAMQAIANGDTDTARQMISDKRSEERSKDVKILEQINKYIENDTSKQDIKKTMNYIYNRVDDPKMERQLAKLLQAGKYDEILKIFKNKVKDDDQKEIDMMKFLNVKSSQYEDLKDEKTATDNMTTEAYDQLRKMGLTGINENNARKYLNLMQTEKNAFAKKKEATEKNIDLSQNKNDTIETTTLKDIEKDKEKKVYNPIIELLQNTVKQLQDMNKNLKDNPIEDTRDSLDKTHKSFKYKGSIKNYNSIMDKLSNNTAEETDKDQDAVKRQVEEEFAAREAGLGATQGYANGGFISKTGVMTGSKGEFVYTPEKAKQMMNQVPDLLKHSNDIADVLESDEKNEEARHQEIVDYLKQTVNKLTVVSDDVEKEDKDQMTTKIDQYGNVMEFIKRKDGEEVPNLADSSTKLAISEAKEAKATQEGILSKLSLLPTLLKPKTDDTEDATKKKSNSTLDTILGVLKKLALAAGVTAAVGAGAKAITQNESKIKDEYDSHIKPILDNTIKPWLDNKFLPWMKDTALPYIGNGIKDAISKGIPLAVDGIKTVLTTGMPGLVHGVAESAKFAVTQVYPALISAVLNEMGLSGKNGESSLGGNLSYAVGRDALTGGNKFSALSKGMEKINPKMPSAGQFIKSPLKSSLGASVSGTEKATKWGVKGIGKVTSKIATPINKLYEGMNSTKLFGKLPSLDELSLKTAVTGKGVTDSLKDKLLNKSKEAGYNSIKKAAETAGTGEVEKAASKGVINSLVKGAEEFVLNLVNCPAVIKLIGNDGAEKMTKDFLPRFLQGLSEQVAKNGAKLTGKLAASISTGGLVNIAFAAEGFVSGYNDCRSILGITQEPTFPMKVGTGFIRAFTSAFIITSIIPDKIFVDLVVDILLPIFGVDNIKLKSERTQAQAEVYIYNKQHGTNYNVEQYDKEVLGDKSIWQKVKDKFGKFVGGVENNVQYLYNQYLSVEKFMDKDTDNIKKLQDKDDGSYWAMPEEEQKDESTPFKQFFFYTNRIMNAPSFYMHKLGKGIVTGAQNLYNDYLSIESFLDQDDQAISELSTTGGSYWSMPPQEQTASAPFKSFFFYTNRILSAPGYYLGKLGQGIVTGAQNLYNDYLSIESFLSTDDDAINSLLNGGDGSYWSMPQTDQTVSAPFKQFFFYTNRVLSAPGYYMKKLGNDLASGFESVYNAYQDIENFMNTDNQSIQSLIDGTDEGSYWTMSQNEVQEGDAASGFKKFLFYTNRIMNAPSFYIQKFFKNFDFSSIIDKVKKAASNAINKTGGTGSKADNSNGDYSGGGGVDIPLTKTNYNKIKNKKFSFASALGVGGEKDSFALSNSDISKFARSGKYPIQIINTKDHPSFAVGGDSLSDYSCGTASIGSATEALRPKIAAAAAKYGVNDVDLLMALTMQESGGDPGEIQDDPMQSAEGHNMGAGTLHNQDQSIDWGVEEFASRLKDANGNIPLTLQSYNFGQGFIDYVKNHGGSMTQDVVNQFSDMEAAQNGWSGYGDKNYVQHVLRYYKGNGTNTGSGTQSASGTSTTAAKPSIFNLYNDLGDLMNNVFNKIYGFDTSTNGTSGTGTSASVPSGLDPSDKNIAIDWFVKQMGATETSGFGPRVLDGAAGFHKGIDMACPQRTPIKSPIEGDVSVNSYDDGGFGNYLVVKDKDGYQHYFGHMVEPSPLAVGTHVKVGDTVGYVGSTGRSTGPHVHYEVRTPGNESIDPDQYLQKYYSGASANTGGSRAVQASSNLLNNILDVGGDETDTSTASIPTINNAPSAIEKLINTIIDILTTISSNTDNLSEIVKLLSAKMNVQIPEQNLQNLSTNTTSKAGIVDALKKSLSNSGGDLSNSDLFTTLNNLASE